MLGEFGPRREGGWCDTGTTVLWAVAPSCPSMAAGYYGEKAIMSTWLMELVTKSGRPRKGPSQGSDRVDSPTGSDGWIKPTRSLDGDHPITLY